MWSLSLSNLRFDFDFLYLPNHLKEIVGDELLVQGVPASTSYKAALTEHAGALNSIIEKVYRRSSFGTVMCQGSGDWPVRALICQKMKSRREALSREEAGEGDGDGGEGGSEGDDGSGNEDGMND